jgi:hypothetical protein
VFRQAQQPAKSNRLDPSKPKLNKNAGKGKLR